jgi:hypothetical protein
MGQFDDLITRESGRILSVVGLAKNSGKTTTLNHIIRAFAKTGRPLGITSTGRDGEEFDALTSSIKKPPICVTSGTLIATGSEYVQTFPADVDVLSKTKFRTQMGPVVICRAKKARQVVLAGPTTNRGIKDVSQAMLRLGCSLVLVDGSINRLSVTSPDISDSVIFTTGASVHEDMEGVVIRTREVIERFKLQEIEGKLKKLIEQEVLVTNKIALIYEDNQYELLSSIIGVTSSDRIVRHLTESVKAVFIPGAFFEEDAISIVQSEDIRSMIFIVEDGSKVFFDVRRYADLGLRLQVLNRTNILCITINPEYPSHYRFDKNEFLDAIKRELSTFSVYDLGALTTGDLNVR